MRMKQTLSRLLVLAVIVLSAGQMANAYDSTYSTHFPVLIPPTQLYVANIHGGADSIGMPTDLELYRRSVVMMESLSGIMLKLSKNRGVFVEATTDNRTILNDLASKYSVTLTYVTYPNDPWYIVDQLKSDFGSDYVLYDLDQATYGPDTLNVARMAAYKYDAIMVDVDMEATAIAHGLTRAFDCRSKDDQWIYNNWLNDTTFDKSVGVSQVNVVSDASYQCLNDYAAATGAFAFYDTSNTTLWQSFLTALDDDSPVLGWVSDELTQIESMSSRNDFSACANYCYNLAMLSAFRDVTPSLSQNTHVTPTVSPNTHYVCFVMSDGDNIQWFNNDFIGNSNYWASTSRGQTNIGWGMCPAMRDLCQTEVDYLYDTASNNTNGKDYFVAMGPVGYGYPSKFSDASRLTNATRLQNYMSTMDLNILTLLDWGGFANPINYQPYLSQSSVDAIFYWEVNGDYAADQGAVKWINSKPIITGRKCMWGSDGPSQIASVINAQGRNPWSAGGYSMIPVHVWTHNVADVVSCKNLLNSNVQVVTPEAFVKLFKANVTPGSSLVDFETGASRLASWVPQSGMTVTVNTNAPSSADGTTCVKFTVGTAYKFANMSFTARNLAYTAPDTALNFELYGDNSGAAIRIQLYNSTYGEFLYKDITLNWSGWKHFALRLDGSNGGMAKYGSHSLDEILGGITILQVSAPWNSTASTFYLDNIKVVGYYKSLIDLGSSQYAAYGTPSSGMTVSVNNAEQKVDGTNSTKFTVAASPWSSVNMTFPSAVNFTAYSTVDFDLWSNNSGAVIRLEFYSQTTNAFVYKDITLNYSGWRHYSLKLDGEDGLQAYGNSYKNILSTANIFQVNGPWNSTAATVYLDNLTFKN